MLEAAYDSGGHDTGPPGGHWVGFDGVEDAHVVLLILGFDGVGLVVGDLCLLVEVVSGLVEAALNHGSVAMRLGLERGTHVVLGVNRDEWERKVI